MIHQLTDATLDPTGVHPDLGCHQAEMIRRCPYLGPSVARGLTEWAAYEAEPHDQRELFGVLVGYAETVRAVRRTNGPLVCRNIALFGPRTTKQAQHLMELPAWVARNLYAPVQIVVDRFWIGTGRRPKPGRVPIQALPVSYFMIRCAIAHRDRIIVSDRPPQEMATLRAGPGDDGRDVIAAQLGYPAEPATAWPSLIEAFPIPARDGRRE